MSDRLLRSDQPMLWDTPAVTTSRVSADGSTLFDWLDGPKGGESGPGRVPANPTPPQGNGEAMTTPATSGPSGSPSSASVTLTSSLVSRLRQRFGSAGSTEYRETWREKATPLGMPYWGHTASGHRTSDSDSTGALFDLMPCEDVTPWPTPSATDWKGSSQPGQRRGQLSEAALMAGWPTPVAQDDNKSVEAHLATKIRMGERDGTGAKRVAITSLQVMAQTVIVGWPTPKATEHQESAKRGNLTLFGTALLVGWATPTVGDSRGARNETSSRQEDSQHHPGQTLCDQVASGTITTSSSAETGRRGVLNPALSLWLMGFPSDWLMAVPEKTYRGQRPSEG